MVFGLLPGVLAGWVFALLRSEAAGLGLGFTGLLVEDPFTEDLLLAAPLAVDMGAGPSVLWGRLRVEAAFGWVVALRTDGVLLGTLVGVLGWGLVAVLLDAFTWLLTLDLLAALVLLWGLAADLGAGLIPEALSTDELSFPLARGILALVLETAAFPTC